MQFWRRLNHKWVGTETQNRKEKHWDWLLSLWSKIHFCSSNCSKAIVNRNLTQRHIWWPWIIKIWIKKEETCNVRRCPRAFWLDVVTLRWESSQEDIQKLFQGNWYWSCCRESNLQGKYLKTLQPIWYWIKIWLRGVAKDH